ncbi:MAG: hypothetical protein JNL69_12315, partial [Bacteroidia bacterium]|nr:hypothetical protein [Bacteroidia bacterium]
HQDVTTELDVFVLNGTYIIEDFLSGKSTTVKFSEDGTIKNFYDYTRYKTFRDLWGTGKQMDRIGLIKNDSTIDNFALKFTKNSLELYTVTCVTFDSIDSICREGGFDRQVYKLNKK